VIVAGDQGPQRERGPKHEIVAVSSNPAIDRVALVAGAAGGGVRRASAFLETAGGKGAHVAAIAGQLGTPVQLVSAADARFVALLEHEHVPATIVPTERTRGTYTVVDEADGDVIEVHEPGTPLDARAAAALLSAATGAARFAAVVVTTGSLGPGLEPSFHASIAAAATGFSIVDTSDVDAMRLALDVRPDLVKPNLDEARALVGGGDPVDITARLLDAGARNAWLSLGPDGSLLATPEGTVRLRAPAPARVVNAVGAGDALLGGLVAGLGRGLGLVAAARLGVAAATAKIAQLHPARVHVDAVERLVRSIHPEPLTEISP
jgi:1-phosphofructokinase family hexose kinase